MASSSLTRFARRFVVLLSVFVAWLSAATAHAGPAELLSHVVVGASNPDLLALPYYYGGSGMFLSSNAGTDFALLCSSAVDQSLLREQDVYTTLVSGSGAIHLAGPTGLWSGGQNGCGWTESAQLKGKWVSDVVADPADPKRSYAVTSVSAEQNGIYENDGTNTTWSMLGSFAMVQLATLRVAKTATGKLFYARGVSSVSGNNHYVIRVSEDNAKTWTEYEFGHAEAQDVRILAVDPTDPNRILVSVVMDTDKTVLPNPPDELWFSPTRGMAGSFMKIAQVGVLRGAVFAADGTLYYGDDAQDSPGLYAIKKLGDAPKQLSSSYPVSCLGYDPSKQRLYACSGYEFGTVDLTTGEFRSTFDKRKVSQFVECPGQPPAATRCREQMVANYCGYGHYWQAPLCATYMLPGSPYDPQLRAGGASGGGAGAAGAVGSAGQAAPSTTGAGTAMPGAGATAPSAGGAATTAGTTAAPAKSGGCSCVLVANRSEPAWPWGLVASWLVVLATRRRRSCHR
jgi:hypothetical protein